MNVDAIILAGGYGTRLQSVVSDRSKVIAYVRGRPFIYYLFDQLCLAGYKKVTLATGHLGEHVERTLGLSYKGLTIQYSKEDQPLGTGGAITKAAGMSSGKWALILTGDSFVDVSLTNFFVEHEKNEQAMSMVVVGKQASHRYGVVELGATKKVVKFSEKGMSNDQLGLISAGVYMIEWSLLRDFSGKKHYSLENDFFPAQVERGIFGYKIDGAFIDIGTPESFAAAPDFFSLFQKNYRMCSVGGTNP